MTGVAERDAVSDDLGPTQQPCALDSVLAEAVANRIHRFFEALVKNDAVVSLRFDRDDRSWLRVSPHFYNTFDEIAKVADVLRKAL